MNDPVITQLRARAEQDITDIHAFYSLHSTSIAKQFLEQVKHHFRLLQRFPSIGRPCYFKSPKLKGLRCLPLLHPFARYMLFYELSENHVTVVAVVHSRRDLLPLFKR